jgi:glycosyltransferase involved in cell wall biosynthesis
MNQMLIGSSLGRDFEFHVVDTSKKRLRWTVEKQSPRSLLDFVRHVFRLLRSLGEVRPDVVYVHAASGVSFTRDWALMAVARLTGHRVVCHYHGTLHTVFPSPRTRFGRLAGRLMMAAAHRVVVLGPTYREAFARAWRHAGVSWSPNLVKVELHRGLPPGSPAPWLAPGERGVLYVGRLSAPKGLFDLYDAIPRVLERHPHTRFLLCGVAESEAQEPVVRAEAERRGIASRVTFLGSLDGGEKALAYACSTAFVSPSWTEGFPLVVPEAMAAGLPMVVTGVGAIPDFVHDGEDGFLVPPRDPAALADRLCRLLGDEPLRARMAARVRERAPREFDVEIGAARVREVLRSLLAAAS